MNLRLPLLFAGLFPLAACSTPGTPPSAQPQPSEAVTDAHASATRCAPEPLQALVGQTATQAVVDKAVRDSGAKTARVVKPGMAVTMDFREDRLTVRVDETNRIIGAGCS